MTLRNVRPTPPVTRALTKDEEYTLLTLLKRWADRAGYEASAELYRLSLNESPDPYVNKQRKDAAQRKLIAQRRAKMVRDFIMGIPESVGLKNTLKKYLPTPTVEDEEHLLCVLLKKRYDRLVKELSDISPDNTDDIEDIKEEITNVILAFEDITGEAIPDE